MYCKPFTPGDDFLLVTIVVKRSDANNYYMGWDMPKKKASSFLLEETRFQKGGKTNSHRDASLERVSMSKNTALRKHAYSNILTISAPKIERFDKILIFFLFLLKM